MNMFRHGQCVCNSNTKNFKCARMADIELWTSQGGARGNCKVQAYNGSLGAKPPVGSRPWSWWHFCTWTHICSAFLVIFYVVAAYLQQVFDWKEQNLIKAIKALCIYVIYWQMPGPIIKQFCNLQVDFNTRPQNIGKMGTSHHSKPLSVTCAAPRQLLLVYKVTNVQPVFDIGSISKTGLLWCGVPICQCSVALCWNLPAGCRTATHVQQTVDQRWKTNSRRCFESSK